MSQPSDAELTAYLEAALESPHGIEISTGDLDYLRRRLYICRRKAKESGDDRFQSITITTSPTERGKLWLVKGEPDVTGED